MLAALALGAIAAAGSAWLAAAALREHHAALAERAMLLDGIAGMFPGGRISMAADGFPTLSARLPDRRHVKVELIPDTMVVRRLPQLWLVVTVGEAVEVRRPSLGALARPTGAEWYACTHELPHRENDPLGVEPSLLIRSSGDLGAAQMERGMAALRAIFADALVKEAVATPRGVRIVRQASEGERGAHLLLRQARFSADPVSFDSVNRCMEAADRLRDALDAADKRIEKLSA